MLVWDQGVWHRVSFRSSKILKTFQSGKLPNRSCWLNSVTFLQYFFISKCLFISLFIYQSSLKSVLSILTNKCGWPSIPNSRPKSKLKSNYKPNIIWVLAVSWITDSTYALIKFEMSFFQYQGQYVNIAVIGVKLVDTAKILLLMKWPQLTSKFEFQFSFFE